MSSVDNLIPKIRESCKALLDLTEEPDTTSPYWFAEVGVHLQRLSDIYLGQPNLVLIENNKGFLNSFKNKLGLD